MSTRYPGGLITKTPVTPTLSSAPGVWTLEQALAYIKAGTWPYQGALDPYFNQTTLLLHGDGNQGATNLYNSGSPAYLAFADNSNNNFPITVQGDAYGSTFSPYEANYSNYFDGSGDGLSLPTSSNEFNFGTGDFTVEFWINYSNLANYQSIISYGYSPLASTGWLVQTDNGNGKVIFYRVGSGITAALASDGGSAISVGQWYHIAVVRNGSTITIYRNGVSVGTGTDSTNFSTSATTLYIGGGSNTGFNNYYVNGAISNIRVVKGTAVYTSNFTPPTAPLTAISGTSLLTCQSNRFVDNSSNNFTITRTGDTLISPFQPFTLAANDYGSGLFNGSGNYVTLPSSSSLSIGSSENFTIEFWIQPTSSIASQGILGVASVNTGIYTDSSGYIYIHNGSLYKAPLTANYLTLNTWQHIAVVRSGSTVTFYRNGVAWTGSYDGTFSTEALNLSALNVGRGRLGSALPFTGQISDLRIVKGTAVYTSNFTPPTTPLTNITNTSLLTCQYSGTVNNTGFIDNGPNQFPIIKFGNTTQGTFSPFSLAAGEWSNFFDGSGDYLSIPDNAAFDFGSGSFTIEAWVYPSDVTPSKAEWIVSQWQSDTQNSWGVRIETSGELRFWYATAGNTASNIAATTPGINENAWNHIAVVRNGNDLTIYVNGVSKATGSLSGVTLHNSTASVIVAGQANTGLNQNFTGYISNVRVVKGTAVYTSAFTPSTAPLTAIANTSLLTCQSNRFVDNSSNNFTITRNGDTRVTPFSPFAPTAPYDPAVNGGSYYGDGTNDYLTTSKNVGLALGTNTWTISLWLYISTIINQTFLSQSVSSNTSNFGLISGGPFLQIYQNGSNSLVYYGTANSVIAGQWNHIAVCHLGSGQYQFYLNGVSQAATAATGYYFNTTLSSASDTSIAYYNYSNSNYINGYMSDLVVKQGIDTAVPTAPRTPTSNDILLLNFTSAGIFDQTGKNVLETVGNAQVDTSVRKYGIGSMKFDGTGDVLVIPNQPDFDFGSGNFTMEMWVYPTTTPNCSVLAKRTSTSAYSPFLFGFPSTLNPQFQASFNNSSWGVTINSSIACTVNTWNHIAVTRNGSTFTLWVNGSSGGTASNSSAFMINTSNVAVGATTTVGDFSLNGYIDDLRITKGVARYTTNFTPPTRAFPNQ